MLTPISGLGRRPRGLTFNTFDPGVIEANAVGGGVTVINSTTELNGNSVSSPVICVDNTVVSAGKPPDGATNICS